VLLCLPPHSTHVLQPLDVGFFSPLKRAWKKVLESWFRESRLHNITKAVFPTLLVILWRNLKASNVSSGFRGTGLFPINIDKAAAKIVCVEKPVIVEEQQRCDPSPHEDLKRAIVTALFPHMSPETAKAVHNSGRERRRVQGTSGEVLTDDHAIAKRLEEKAYRSTKRKRNIAISTSSSTRLPKNMVLIEIPRDGNFMFTAIAKAVYGKVTKKIVREVRKNAIGYILLNFEKFMPTILSTHNVQSKDEYEKKLKKDGEFGDHEELLALSLWYQLAITVHLGSAFQEQSIISAQFKERLHVHLQDEHYSLIETPLCVDNWVIVLHDDLRPGQIVRTFPDGRVDVHLAQK
jgi:hypothetical protein